MKVVQLLGSWRLWQCHMCRDTNYLSCRSYSPNRIFLASGSWRSEGLFGWSFSIAQYIRHLKRPLARVLLCCLEVRCLKVQPLYCSAISAGMWGERGCSDDHPLHMPQQYRLASVAAWFSSTGIAHHSPLSHSPLGHLLTVSSRPHPGILPQSLHSSSQPLCLLEDLPPCPAYIWLQQRLSDSHSI